MPKPKPKKPATNDKPAKAAKPANLTLIKGLLLANRKTMANPGAMRRAAKALGVDLPKTRGPKADAELLSALRLEVNARLQATQEKDHVQCEACEEVATEATMFCPYCGDMGVLKNPDGTVVEGERSGNITDLPEEDEEEEEETPVSQEAVDDGGGEDDEVGDDDADDESEGDDEDESGEDAEDDDDEAAAATVGISAKGSAVTKNVDAALVGLQRDLDEAVSKLEQLTSKAKGLSYDMGLVCRDIRDRQLFKAKGYSSFKAFAEKELPFRRESAINLINIVEKNSREEFEALGYAKLRLIGAVADVEVKQQLIDEAKRGATTKQLTERASAAGAVTSKKQPPPDKGERITLLGKVGAKKSVAKFHNSETGEVIPNAGTFNKKTFIPSAYISIEVGKDVWLRVGLRTGANYELEGLTYRFVRSGEDA